MKKQLLVAAALIAFASSGMAQDKHTQVTPDAVIWKDNPAFPKGVQVATLVACEPVHIHVVSTSISWPRQGANMHPTRNQQLAIRAILNALIGPGEFDRLCLGMRVECVEDGILYVFVPNEDCAAKIEANYSDDLAVAAEQVFSRPIRIVNVLPMDLL